MAVVGLSQPLVSKDPLMPTELPRRLERRFRPNWAELAFLIAFLVGFGLAILA